MTSTQDSYYKLVDLIYDNSKYVNTYSPSFMDKAEAFSYAENLKEALTNSSENDLSRLKRDLSPTSDLEAIQKIIDSLPSGPIRYWGNDQNNTEAKKFMRIYGEYQEAINVQTLIILKTLQGTPQSQATSEVRQASSFSAGDDVSEYIKNQYLPNLPKQSKEPPKQEKSDCFVVTATYGTPHAKEVIRYRNFRDNYLRKFFLGRILIRIYESVGPYLAQLVTRSAYVKSISSFTLGWLSNFLPNSTL
jgi:hypothetical protein